MARREAATFIILGSIPRSPFEGCGSKPAINKSGDPERAKFLQSFSNAPSDEVGSYRYPLKVEFTGSIPVWSIRTKNDFVFARLGLSMPKIVSLTIGEQGAA